MNQNAPRRRMSTDQKRALLIVAIMVIAIVAIGMAVFQLGAMLGIGFWIAVILIAVIVLAVILLAA